MSRRHRRPKKNPRLLVCNRGCNGNGRGVFRNLLPRGTGNLSRGLTLAKWFVVAVCHEKLALRCLEVLGHETYAPQREAAVPSGKAPLFPGYLFVAFDPMEPSWCRILRSLGVVTILGVNREKAGEHFPPPIPLPDGFVDGLRAHVASLGGIVPKPLPPAPEPLLKGQRVVVEDGVFSGIEALVEADEGDRVRILLDILGCSVSTLLPRAAVMETAAFGQKTTIRRRMLRRGVDIHSGAQGVER